MPSNSLWEAQTGVGTCPGPPSWPRGRCRPRRKTLASWSRSLQVPTLPGRGQVLALRLPQPPQGTTRRQLAAPQPAPLHWASRGTPGLVVHGRLRQPARCNRRTPTPRRPRAAKIAPCQRFNGTMRASLGPRGCLPDRPPAGAEPTWLAALLELTDFVGQFVRHAGGVSAQSDGHGRRKPALRVGTCTGRAALGRDLR